MKTLVVTEFWVHEQCYYVECERKGGRRRPSFKSCYGPFEDLTAAEKQVTKMEHNLRQTGWWKPRIPVRESIITFRRDQVDVDIHIEEKEVSRTRVE